MVNNRLYWADYTKAFAIWLMVLCHFGLRPNGLVEFIYVFHMPVFFLISGYFDKGERFSLSVLKSSFKKIMVPYFFFSVCSFSICWISPYIHPEIYHNGTILQSFGKAFVGMLLMEDKVRPYAFMPTGALWFLVALFIIKNLFSILCLCCKKNKTTIGIIAIIAILIVYNKIPFFSIDSALLALPFYIIGFFMKKINFFAWPLSKWMMLFLSMLCWIYTIVIGVKNGAINIDACLFGENLVMFYINGVIGSLACIYLFRCIDVENRYLQQVGAGTLTILGTHGYINKAITIIAVLLLGVKPSEIPIWYIVMSSIIALEFGILAEKFLNIYCPAMIGKAPQNCQ